MNDVDHSATNRDHSSASAGALWRQVTWPRVVAAALPMFFLFPIVYGCAVRYLPTGAYYNIATVLGPPAWTAYHTSVDANRLDSGSRAELIENAIGLAGDIAHLNKDGYLPARTAASGRSPEAPGKVWTASQCLFIKRIRLVALEVYQDVNKEPRTRPLSDSQKFTPNERTALDREFVAGANSGAVARTYRRDLGDALRAHGVTASACPDPRDPQAHGPFCPRIAVWAYGVPAPCSIRPF